MKKNNRLSTDRITRMRTQEIFDFLKLIESDLTMGQSNLVRSMRKQNKLYGLSQKQLHILFEIKKALEPDNEILIVRNYQ